MEHEANGDMGYEWLKTNSAGSGPYMLRAWKANDSIVLEEVEGYWGGDVALKRVFVRHVPESASRRLLVENGDADIARRLTPNDAEAIAANPELKLFEEQRGRIYYLGANQKHEALAKPEVVAGAQISHRLRRHGELDPEGPVRRPPGLFADRLPRRARGKALQARRREGEGASRPGRLPGRLRRRDLRPQRISLPSTSRSPSRTR